MSNLAAFIKGLLNRRQSKKPALEVVQLALTAVAEQLNRLAELTGEVNDSNRFLH